VEKFINRERFGFFMVNISDLEIKIKNLKIAIEELNHLPKLSMEPTPYEYYVSCVAEVSFSDGKITTVYPIGTFKNQLYYSSTRNDGEPSLATDVQSVSIRKITLLKPWKKYD